MATEDVDNPATKARGLATTTQSDALAFLDRSFSLTSEGVRQNLSTEISERYEKVWDTASRCYPEGCSVPFDIPTELLVALFAYSLECPNVCKRFNRICRSQTSRGGPGWDSFPYKSLWWLLIEGLMFLPEPPEEKCVTLYRGVNEVTRFPAEGTTITFGQFLSASPSRSVAKRFALRQGTVLELRGVPSTVFRSLSPYALYYQHNEVLLLPFCAFDVGPHRDDVLVLTYRHCVTTSPVNLRRIHSRLWDFGTDPSPELSSVYATESSPSRPDAVEEDAAWAMGVQQRSEPKRKRRARSRGPKTSASTVQGEVKSAEGAKRAKGGKNTKTALPTTSKTSGESSGVPIGTVIYTASSRKVLKSESSRGPQGTGVKSASESKGPAAKHKGTGKTAGSAKEGASVPGKGVAGRSPAETVGAVPTPKKRSKNQAPPKTAEEAQDTVVRKGNSEMSAPRIATGVTKIGEGPPNNGPATALTKAGGAEGACYVPCPKSRLLWALERANPDTATLSRWAAPGTQGTGPSYGTVHAGTKLVPGTNDKARTTLESFDRRQGRQDPHGFEGLNGSPSYTSRLGAYRATADDRVRMASGRPGKTGGSTVTVVGVVHPQKGQGGRMGLPQDHLSRATVQDLAEGGRSPHEDATRSSWTCMPCCCIM